MKANQSISNLQLDLQTLRVGAKTYKADYNTKVTCLQLENSFLQSALGALKTEVTEEKRRLSLGIIDFTQWICENSVNADTLISVPDLSTSSSDIHHVLAHNALVKVRLEEFQSTRTRGCTKGSLSFSPWRTHVHSSTSQVYCHLAISHGSYCQGSRTNQNG